MQQQGGNVCMPIILSHSIDASIFQIKVVFIFVLNGLSSSSLGFSRVQPGSTLSPRGYTSGLSSHSSSGSPTAYSSSSALNGYGPGMTNVGVPSSPSIFNGATSKCISPRFLELNDRRRAKFARRCR